MVGTTYPARRMDIRTYEDADRLAVDLLVADRSDHDGRDALSEHKALRVGDASVVQMVATTEAGLVGYALAAHHDARDGIGHWALEVVVTPACSDPSGVIHDLTVAVRRRLPEEHPVTFWGWRDPEYAAAAIGDWEPVRELHQMSVDLPIGSQRPLPPSFEITTFRRGVDEDAWLEANALAFATHPENSAVDMANLERRLSQPWFDAAGFLLAWSGDALAGYCWTKLHPRDVGEIYIIGVVPAFEGQGLGSALLHAGLHDLAGRQGAQTGILYVDALQERAIEIYQRVGFEVSFTLREFVVPPQP